jgi:ElaB/YqjD/DUF883 family membrane-anchored ribosome-binding protein
MSDLAANQMIDHAAASTNHALGVAQRSVAAVRDSTQHLLDRAHQASDTTVTYIKGEPVKAMLIAAAAGAALMALAGLLTRSHDHT